eukprot:COSAG02_NODE_4220_length_5616_cov_13.985862_4_plen_237_part_00
MDPSRIRITSLDMVEVEVGTKAGRRREGVGPAGVGDSAARTSGTKTETQAHNATTMQKHTERDLRDKSVGQLRRMCEEETAIEQRDIDDADEARDRKQAFSDLLLGVRDAGSSSGGGGGGSGGGQSKYSESDLRDKSVGQLRRMCEEETAIEQRDIDDADEARDRKQAFSDLLLGVRDAGSSSSGGSRSSGNTAVGASGLPQSTRGAESESQPRQAAQSSRGSASSPSSSKKKKKR